MAGTPAHAQIQSIVYLPDPFETMRKNTKNEDISIGIAVERFEESEATVGYETGEI